MTYTYAPRLNPKVGKGLGGLPKRKVAAVDFIESIVHSSIDINGIAVSNALTVAEMDLSRTYVQWTGNTGNALTTERLNCRILISDPTEIQAHRFGGLASNNTTVFFDIITLVKAPKQIIQGIIAINGVSTNTTSIAEVDPDKSLLIYNGYRTSDFDAQEISATLELISSTQVRGTIGKTSSSGANNIGFTVVEF